MSRILILMVLALPAALSAADRDNLTGQRPFVTLVQRETTAGVDADREADRQRQIANAEKTRARENLVASQLLLGKMACDNGDIAETLCWYHQAYFNSEEGAPTRASARNLIGAWGTSLEATLLHPATVHALAVSPDGKKLFAGYLRSQSQLWDLESGEPLGEPQKYSGDMNSAQFSPDGKSILTGDWGGMQVWDVETGQLRFPKLPNEIDEGSIFRPALSPDGRTIATRSDRTYKVISLWDAQTGQPRGAPLVHDKEVWQVQFSPDSKFIATLGSTEVGLWEVATGVRVGNPLQNVRNVAFHPGGELMATCTKDGKVTLRNIRDDKFVVELHGDVEAGYVSFDRTGDHLLVLYDYSASWKERKHVVIWRNVTIEERTPQVLPHANVGSSAFSPDGQYVLTKSDQSVRIWKIGEEQAVWDRQIFSRSRFEPGASFTSATFSPDSQSVLAFHDNGMVEVFEASRGRLLLREERVRTATFTPDGKRLIVGSNDGWVRIRKVQATDPREVALLQHPNSNRDLRTAVFSPKGNLLVTAGEDKIVQFWDTSTWQPIGDPLLHEGPVFDLAISPDGKLVVAAVELKERKQCQLEFRDLTTRELLGKVLLDGSASYFPAFDITGKTLLAHYNDYNLVDVETRKVIGAGGIVRIDGQSQPIVKFLRLTDPPLPELWDAETNEPIQLQLPEKDLGGAILSQNGRGLITRNKAGFVQLWDAHSGKPLGPRIRNDGAFRQCSPDGRYVLISGATGRRIYDQNLQMWDTHTGRPCGGLLIETYNHADATFTPSGDRVAVGWQGVVRLVDCATGQLLGPPLTLGGNGMGKPAFSPDEQLLVLPYGRARVWRIPPPAEDAPGRLQLSVEVRTGLRVDENGALQKLSHEEWLDRKKLLKKLGGPCDVPANSEKR